ncbi:MAG: hypothetical protein PF485_09605 [Bacteroidales bacterium]|jgi:hypothetical protein|nr:hypothetical protein [Bacteroidales bacterium]
MKSHIVKYFIIFIISFLYSNLTIGQSSTIENCANFLNSGFVSDGQEYKANLDENNKSTFYTTFYGGSQYRIIACSNIKDIPLIFSVYDTEKNILFCNKNFDYTPFWNFSFTSTIDCIIEMEFKSETLLKDEVMLLIGFKEK